MIATLENTPLETIHDAFIDAFSEYEVRIDLPLGRLQEMLVTRSYRADHSLGFFSEEGTLAGFILVGYREREGKKDWYDVATGVRQAYQGKKVGDQLLRHLMADMGAHGVEHFILEVLENNVSAQKLYKKYGFNITRKFHCYEMAKPVAPVAPGFVWSGDADALVGLSPEAYCGFAPSWQNTLESYCNVADLYEVALLMVGDSVSGYGMVHRHTGRVLQLGVHPSEATISMVKCLCARLGTLTGAPHLTFLNVEAGSRLDTLLAQAGATQTFNQFEMVYPVD